MNQKHHRHFHDNCEIRTSKVYDQDYDYLFVAGDTGSWETGPHFNWTQDHHPNILKYVKHWRTAVQAGGCHGAYPHLLSEMFDTVYTFEPTAISFHCLVNNCQSENIIKLNAALGAEHQMISVSHNNGNLGANSIQGKGKIPMLLLDDFDFDHLDLLMLDVESYEDKVIAGGRKTIAKFKPVIFAECGVHAQRQFLEELGYQEVARSSADVVYVSTHADSMTIVGEEPAERL
jgi:FkbM family methyltransferase